MTKFILPIFVTCLFALPFDLCASEGNAMVISQSACLSPTELKKANSASSDGDLVATRSLARHYGECVEDGERKEIELYELAAKFGFSEDIWNLAATLDDSGEHDSAFPLFLHAAKQGDRDAMRRVAIAYIQGIGTNKDLDEAMMWLESDAKQCGRTSAVNLANILASKVDDRISRIRSLTWMTIAMRQGEAPGAVSNTNASLRNRMSPGDVELSERLAGDMLRSMPCAGMKS